MRPSWAYFSGVDCVEETVVSFSITKVNPEKHVTRHRRTAAESVHFWSEQAVYIPVI